MFMFFFFKQKTAYELRISDWSSDVCSSDLTRDRPDAVEAIADKNLIGLQQFRVADVALADWQRKAGGARHDLGAHYAGDTAARKRGRSQEIGRASCRERVCQYV